MFYPVDGKTNEYELLNHNNKWDGNLSMVGPNFDCKVGYDTVKAPIFAADNAAFHGVEVDHERPGKEKTIIHKKFWPVLLKEAFYLKSDKTMLDQVAQGVNHVVDYIFQPQLEKQKQDPNAPQLPWILKDLDFLQFKC